MLFIKIDQNSNYLDLYLLDEHPTIEVDGEQKNDPSYIAEPIPNDIYFGAESPPRWTGTQWVATGQPPEQTPQEPTELELLMLAVAELDMQRELDRTENQVAIAELAESLLGGI